MYSKHLAHILSTSDVSTRKSVGSDLLFRFRPSNLATLMVMEMLKMLHPSELAPKVKLRLRRSIKHGWPTIHI